MRVETLGRPAIVASLCAGLTACGGGTHRSTSTVSAPAAFAPPASSAQAGVCSRAVRHAASIALGGRRLTATAYGASDGSLGCRLQTAASGTARGSVDIRVDSSPQAFFRLDREQIETSQNVFWSHSSSRNLPEPVDGLGEAAFWFPTQARLAATDGTRLVSVVVRGTPRSRRLALSKLVVRSVLGGS